MLAAIAILAILFVVVPWWDRRRLEQRRHRALRSFYERE
jgi:hypothetical protein